MESYLIRDLRFTYPGREQPALRGISLGIGQGEFVTLCGPSGGGKTTLLRLLKPVLAPHGEKSGEILFCGEPVDNLPRAEQSAKIGFVLQDVENQLVTDKVWHELAFGLESLGAPTPAIRLAVAEMAAFFGIESWFYKNVSELSGGQKQLLNLASIMAMRPSVLMLDEPTSQLDPIAAADFLATVGKINRELGVTVIMTEHRLEEAFPMSDRAVCIESGEIIASGTPRQVGSALRGSGHGMFRAMPAPMRIWAGAGRMEEPPNDRGGCPLTVREGRAWLDGLMASRPASATPVVTGARESNPDTSDCIELRDVWFRYEKEAPDVIRRLTASIERGRLFCIVGGNGAGKTTALSLMAGLIKPQRGDIKLPDKGGFGVAAGLLPQNPQTLFVRATVKEDLAEMLSGRKISTDEKEKRLGEATKLCRLGELLDAHPYDLSGGEQQRAALAKLLLLKPAVLLLDEPTKGLDAGFKRDLAGILKNLTAEGVTVILVSHDIEFCAEHADRCAMLFDGSFVAEGSPREFFSANSFYTTAANRMARQHFPLAVTAGDVLRELGAEDEPWDGPDDEPPPASGGESGETPGQKPPPASGVESGETPGQKPPLAWDTESGVAPSKPATTQKAPATAGARSPRSMRATLLSALMLLIVIPLTIYAGMRFFGDRRYYFISALIILETMLPFLLLFEGRRPQAREIVVLSVLCALGVAGRGALFMLPHVKPVAAIVIITGVALGGEAGFLVGAMAGFLSNFFFGQGPWTPWQMLAYGIIGFLAGLLFKNRQGRRKRIAICVYGGIAAFAIYGGLVNISSVMMYQHSPTAGMMLAYIAQGAPLDLIHAAATVGFLAIVSRPLLEKLDRIKLKFGLLW